MKSALVLSPPPPALTETVWLIWFRTTWYRSVWYWVSLANVFYLIFVPVKHSTQVLRHHFAAYLKSGGRSGTGGRRWNCEVTSQQVMTVNSSFQQHARHLLFTYNYYSITVQFVPPLWWSAGTVRVNICHRFHEVRRFMALRWQWRIIKFLFEDLCKHTWTTVLIFNRLQ